MRDFRGTGPPIRGPTGPPGIPGPPGLDFSHVLEHVYGSADKSIITFSVPEPEKITLGATSMPVFICCNTILYNEDPKNHPLLPIELYQYIGTFLGETKPQSIHDFHIYTDYYHEHIREVTSFETYDRLALRFDLLDYFASPDQITSYVSELVYYQPQKCLQFLLPSLDVSQSDLFRKLCIGFLTLENTDMLKMVLKRTRELRRALDSCETFEVINLEVLEQAVDVRNIENLSRILEVWGEECILLGQCHGCMKKHEMQRKLVERTANNEYYECLLVMKQHEFENLVLVSYIAAVKGSSALLDLVIQHDFPRHGDCCYEAAKRGHDRILKRMVQAKFPALGNDIFTITAKMGHTRCLKILLGVTKMSYHVHGECEAYGMAVRGGHVDCLKLLLEHDFPKNGNECYLAVEALQPECLKLLIDHDFPVNFRDCTKKINKIKTPDSDEKREKRMKCRKILNRIFARKD